MYKNFFYVENWTFPEKGEHKNLLLVDLKLHNEMEVPQQENVINTVFPLYHCCYYNTKWW